MRKIIIAGSRGFDGYWLVRDKLDIIIGADSDVEIISGCARGPDTLGERYAHEKGFKTKLFPADWKTYGAMAGPIRNNEMAEYGTELVAFWDGKTRGTASMIRSADAHNFHSEIIKINYYHFFVHGLESDNLGNVYALLPCNKKKIICDNNLNIPDDDPDYDKVSLFLGDIIKYIPDNGCLSNRKDWNK